MNEILASIGSAVSWLAAFLTEYPTAQAILLAVILSWGGVMILASLLRKLLPDSIERDMIRLLDVFVASLVCGYNWPLEHSLWWAPAVGIASAILYYPVIDLWLCGYFPQLRQHISLRELSPELDQTDSACADGDPPPFDQENRK